VPVAPLRTEAVVRREGRRIQLVETRLLHAGVEVAAARILRVRVGDEPELGPDGQRATQPPLPEPPPPPGEVGLHWVTAEEGGDRPVRSLPGYIRAIDLARAAPTVLWTRLRVPVVAGEPTSPAVRLAAFADFASGSASLLDPTTWSAVNPDVSVHVLREPVGEWIATDARAWYATDAIGHSRADLFDRHGFVATATTATVVERTRAPFA
jgi:hypothetical protein